MADQNPLAQVYAAVHAMATQVVADAFGPRWRTLPESSQSQIVDTTWRQWASSVGSPSGLVDVRPRPNRRGVPQPPSIELRIADLDVLSRSFKPVAEEAARAFDWAMASDTLELADEVANEEEPEVRSPSEDAQTRAAYGRSRPADQLQLAALTDDEDSAEREAAIAKLSAALAQLDTSTESSERARSLLVRLHLGERVFVGAPRTLFPTRTYSRTKKRFYTPRDRKTGRQHEGAFDDFMRYHASGRAKQGLHGGCPTCLLLARFVRVSGMTQNVVSQVMNDFVTFARTGG